MVNGMADEEPRKSGGEGIGYINTAKSTKNMKMNRQADLKLRACTGCTCPAQGYYFMY
jgi:hypothetical protein